MRLTWAAWAAIAACVAVLTLVPSIPAAGVTVPDVVGPTAPAAAPAAPVYPGFVVDDLYQGHLPQFPTNLTHFVYIVRENHVFDDYLGNCATTINASCDGGKDWYLSPNHINDTPDLHALARNYSVFDNYYSSLDPYSAEAHAYFFAANATSSDSCSTGGVEGTGPGTEWAIYNDTNVRDGNCAYGQDSGSQSYPGRGTVFNRFIDRSTSFLVIDDFVWELSDPACTLESISGIAGSLPGNAGAVENITCSGTNGWWLDPSTDEPTMPPVINPVTHVPQLLDVCEYTCGVYGSGTSSDPFLDQYVANNFISFVKDYGLPTYTFLELFDDHPGPQCGAGETYDTCIQWNDAATNSIVRDVMQATSAYRNSTVIAIQDDDTQNGQNGPDHVNNGRRLPLVVVAPHPIEFSGGTSCGISNETECGFVDHQTTNTSNILAVMERVEMNVDPGIFETQGYGGASTFPMEQNDYLAEGSPLEGLWDCASPRVLCNTGIPVSVGGVAVTPSTGNVSAGGSVALHASAIDGNGYPLDDASFSWNVSGRDSANATLNDSTGSNVTVEAGPTAGPLSVCVTASLGPSNRTACAAVSVIPARLVLSRVALAPGLSVGTNASAPVAVRLYDQFGRTFANPSVSYRWTVTPSYLGSLSPGSATGGQNSTEFTASTFTGSGTISVAVQNATGPTLTAHENVSVTSAPGNQPPPSPTKGSSASGGIPYVDWILGLAVAGVVVAVAAIYLFRRRRGP